MNNDSVRVLRAEVGRAVLIALLLAGLVAACYRFVDIPAATWARGLAPGTVAVFRVVTALGYSGPWLAALAIVYPIARWRLRRPQVAQRALFVFVAVALSGLVVNLVKWVAGRWRPDPFFEVPSRYGFALFEFGYARSSFPSGHATTAAALACALALLYPRWRGLWSVAAALVAASRVLVGSHYPGDVVAGLWLGAVVTLGLARTSWFRDALAGPAGTGRGV